MKKQRLILGSGGKQYPDAVTVDIDPAYKPDVVHDLHLLPWPFKDDEFVEIICHHILEYLNDVAGCMSELHRICRPDGLVYIEVSHHTSWGANIPDHKLRFNYYAFDNFLMDKDSWRRGKKFRLIKREITFHPVFQRLFLEKLFNRFPDSYERFWAYIFPAEHFKIWLSPDK